MCPDRCAEIGASAVAAARARLATARAGAQLRSALVKRAGAKREGWAARQRMLSSQLPELRAKVARLEGAAPSASEALPAEAHSTGGRRLN